MDVALLAAALLAPIAPQASEFSLRFHGTGANQQDRVRLRIDDDAAGPDASAPCDVGAGDFTLELWLRAKRSENAAPGDPSGAGDGETADESWRSGNVFLDRDVAGGTLREFGASLAGGHVRFGTGAGDAGDDQANTIEGSVDLLDDQWHHVALVRDAASGVKSLYVDGVLDFASAAGASDADLSYPDAGVPGQGSPWGPFLVLGAEKHDLGAGHPSYSGFLDELRIWDVARTAGEIAATWNHAIPPDASGLVANYRCERGTGTELFDVSAAASPTGELIAGVVGNGEWKARSVWTGYAAPIEGDLLPAGFRLAQVAGGFTEPTTLEALPDGRLLVGERAGAIRVIQGGGVLPAPLVTLPTDTQMGERGLVALALDPQFASNGWLYAYYTTPEPRNRVGRFTVVGDVADPASEYVVWENPDLAADWHHGGALGFLADGTLLIATGDQFDSRNAQERANQHGKLLRLNADGSIPADNPFVHDPGCDPAIYALGLRNPFRAWFDAPTGLAFVGNVGGNSATSWEEIELVRAGANHGWPDQEGPDCFLPDCSAFDFPLFSYQHDDPRYVDGAAQGSLILGPIVRGDAYPEEYRGQLWFGDYASRWLRRLVVDASGSVVADAGFAAAPAAGTLVDLALDADGSLLLLDIGIGWSGAGDAPAVWRLEWSGSGNLAPVAVASAAPLGGPAPLSVQFTGSASFDPNGGPSPLAYAWDFGDGGVATAPDPLHVYAQRGLYHAVLTVDDGASTASASPLPIMVGTPPRPFITTPKDAARYRAGDVIPFAGFAHDLEDGKLPWSALSWQVVLVHEQHVHPFRGPIAGQPAGAFVVPRRGHPPERTHFEIVLSATDADGLPAQASVALEPDSVPLLFDTVPSGLALFVDGEAMTTPRRYESLARYEHDVEAPLVQEENGVTWAFSRFLDGGTRRRRFTTPDPDPTPRAVALVAEYVATTLHTEDVAVASADANAAWLPAQLEELADASDPGALRFGRDFGGVWQAALEFELAIPRPALILGAALVLSGTDDSTGSAIAEIRAYAADDAPPFDATHTHRLTKHAPLGTESVTWTPPAFASGQDVASPDLAALLQEVVDRPGWHGGQRVGFVLDGKVTLSAAWRCFRNQQSGAPARLLVTWIDRPPLASRH